MREVVITTYCDRCIDGGTREPATLTFTVGVVDSAKTRPQLRVVELCERHGKDLVELRDFVHTRGIAPEDAAPPPPSERRTPHGNSKTGPCPACGVYMSAPRNMARHIYVTHLGTELPEIPPACPECGWEGQAASMGVHRMTAHGTSSASDAYAALTTPARARRGRPRKTS